jgi:hypothetical protein
MHRDEGPTVLQPFSFPPGIGHVGLPAVLMAVQSESQREAEV